jgi:hypothetical protein
MTLTAMRPEVGLGKGREVSLLRVSHASLHDPRSSSLTSYIQPIPKLQH